MDKINDEPEYKPSNFEEWIFTKTCRKCSGLIELIPHGESRKKIFIKVDELGFLHLRGLTQHPSNLCYYHRKQEELSS